MNQKVVFYTVYIKKNGWNISAYSTPKPTSDNFLDLLKISDADRMFVEENIRNSQRELFLLKSGKRSVIISTHLYFSSELLFAAMIDEPVDFIVSLINRGELRDVIKAPSCEAAETLKRLSEERRERAVTISNRIHSLVAGISVIPEIDAYILYLLMSEKARLVESFSDVKIEIENGGIYGYVENYDISMYSAFLLISSSYIKRAGVSREGKIKISSLGEKLYVVLEVDAMPNTRAFEFDYLRICADAVEVALFVTEEKGKTRVVLCSQRPDLSKIGLKNKIYFS